MVSRYDDFDPGVRFYRKKCQEIHVQNLQNVKKVLDITTNKEEIQSRIVSVRQRKQKNLDFHKKTRTTNLMHENAKLVRKIEGIHFRAPPSYTQQADKDSYGLKARRSTLSQKRGSLNFVNRKNEVERIQRENLMMFEKLKQSKPNLRKCDFDDSFEMHKRYQATVSKASEFEKIVQSQIAPSTRSLKSPQKNNYLYSQRSAATLPPIIDMRSPRKSLPVSQTPKFLNSENTRKVGRKTHMPASTSRASLEKPVPLDIDEEDLISTLPEIVAATITHSSAQNGTRNLVVPVSTKAAATNDQKMNSFISQKLRYSALRLGSNQLSSPLSNQLQQHHNAYGLVQSPTIPKKRTKKSKRSRNQHANTAAQVSSNNIITSTSQENLEILKEQDQVGKRRKNKSRSRRSKKRLQIVEVSGMKNQAAAGTSMTEPNSRANSGEAHTHSLSNNTKETPSKSRIQEVLTKLDSQSAQHNLDTDISPINILNDNTNRKGDENRQQSTLSIGRREEITMPATAEPHTLQLKKPIAASDAHKSNLTIGKRDSAIVLVGQKKTSALSLIKKQEEKQQASETYSQQSQQHKDELVTDKDQQQDSSNAIQVSDIWDRYDAQDNGYLEREELRGFLQETVDTVLHSKQSIQDEKLDSVFLTFDLANKGRIQRYHMNAVVRYVTDGIAK